MNRLLKLFFVLAVVSIACSPPKKPDENTKKTSELGDKSKPNKVPEVSLEGYEGDRYRLVFSFINNRAVVYLSDSLIYDSGTVDGTVDVELELTTYVEAGMTDLKVDIYNGWPPYNTVSPDWNIAYDIYVNEELAEFVTEGSKDGEIGLVHTENHDLSNLWD